MKMGKGALFHQPFEYFRQLGLDTTVHLPRKRVDDAAARRDLKMIPLRPTEPMYYRPNNGAGGMR